ncbi:MAG: DUF748 domain-containing protein, partial [Myxococcales bacterium]|nr:DUF748 domain-containing protein [Myxococcales bacterium]
AGAAAAPKDAVPASAPAARAAAPDAGPASILGGLFVQRLRIEDGLVAYTDAALVKGKTLQAELVDLRVSADKFRFNEPVPIEASFRTPQHEAIALSGEVGPIPADFDFARAGFDLRLKGEGVRAHDWAVWAPKLPVQLHSGIFDCDVKAKGSLTAPIATSGFLSFTNLALTDSDGAKVGPLDVRLDHDLTADLPNERATIRKGVVKIGDLALTAKGTASAWTTVPAFDLDLDVADVEVGKVLGLHPKVAGALPKGMKVAGTLGFTGKLMGTAKAPGVKGTVRLAKVDASTKDLSVRGATGTVVTDFKMEGKAMRVDADANLQTLGLEASGARVNGPVVLKAKAEKPADAWIVDAHAVLDGADVAFKDQFRKPAATTLQVDFKGTSKADRLDIGAAQVRLADMRVDAKGAVESLDRQALRLEVGTSEIDLASLARSIPALTKFQPTGKVRLAPTQIVGSPKAMDKLRLTGAATLRGVGATAEGLPKPIRDLTADVTLTGPGAETKGATLSVGEERLTVDAKVTGFAKPSIQYDVKAPKVNLAAWMPPAKDAGSKPGPREVQDLRVVGTAQLGGALAADARVTAKRAQYDTLAADGLDGKVRYANDVANLQDFT